MSESDADQIRFMVKMPPTLYGRLTAAARRDHISRSDVVRLLLSEHLPDDRAHA